MIFYNLTSELQISEDQNIILHRKELCDHEEKRCLTVVLLLKEDQSHCSKIHIKFCLVIQFSFNCWDLGLKLEVNKRLATNQLQFCLLHRKK